MDSNPREDESYRKWGYTQHDGASTHFINSIPDDFLLGCIYVNAACHLQID